MQRDSHITFFSYLTPLFIVSVLLLFGCVQPDERIDPSDDVRYQKGTHVGPIPEIYTTTKKPYDLSDYKSTLSSSVMPINKLIELAKKDSQTWYQFSLAMKQRFDDIYSQCGSRSNSIGEETQLPATIVGVVTFHPRYYRKLSFCGTDTKNYGSFWIQDKSGGILVVRNSRLSSFDVGDVIEMEVHGVHLGYGLPMVILSDKIKKLSPSSSKTQNSQQPLPIYTQPVSISDPSLENKIGEVVTVKGKLTDLPTNYNFNTAVIEEINDSSKKIYISFDREVAQRQPVPLKKDDIIEVSGPLTEGYNGLEIPVIQKGQYCVKDTEANCPTIH